MVSGLSDSLNRIIDALNLNELPLEEREKIILDLNALIFRGSIMRMIEQMDQATKDTFAKLVESDVPEEELQAFITENVPQADQAVADTIAALTSDILASTNSK